MLQVLSFRLPIHCVVLHRRVSTVASLLDVILAWGLIFLDEIFGRVLTEPIGQLGQLLPKTVDGLLIHIGLGDEFWE